MMMYIYTPTIGHYSLTLLFIYIFKFCLLDISKHNINCNLSPGRWTVEISTRQIVFSCKLAWDILEIQSETLNRPLSSSEIAITSLNPRSSDQSTVQFESPKWSSWSDPKQNILWRWRKGINFIFTLNSCVKVCLLMLFFIHCINTGTCNLQKMGGGVSIVVKDRTHKCSLNKEVFKIILI